MPKRNDIHKVLIIGSGPIIIGQACEFDYSGTQACKALRQLGYEVVLVNSNPATIMTDPDTADAVYIEPLNTERLEQVIAKERPDALLPNLGGQSGLNLAADLEKQGILEKYGVQVIGVQIDAIERGEDREAFKELMESLDIEMARSKVAYSVEDAVAIADELGYPCVLRPAYTMGGTGGGLVYNIDELRTVVARGLAASPVHEVLVEESVLGWEELELEVVRDANGKMITVCFIENIDPMGVHVSSTKDSAYYFSTYNAPDASPTTGDNTIMILGGGPNRIGQGIEFDYCCVHAAKSLKKLGFKTIIVNCNPETVSTDYDTSDKLYFEPLTAEDVLAIYEKEKPLGVIAQFGGQTPLNLASELEEAGVHILGTSPEIIDLAEDRDRFRAVMDSLGIPMPEAGMAHTTEDALAIAQKIGYPVMVRPSYVLGGRGMEVVYDDANLINYMDAAVGVTPDRPILIDRFLRHAMECEADAICDGTHAFVPAVMEHIELAGIHSGDSACILPSVNISDAHLATIKEYTRRIAEAMHVVGLMNIQYAIEDDTVYVLEANPRASRTVPLVSKVCGIQMVQIATDIMTESLTGRPSPIKDLHEATFTHYGVKEAVFPFNMFPEVDPVLGPEMRSTGEVLGLSTTFGGAFFKAQEATQTVLPKGGTVLMSISDRDKGDLEEVGREFERAGMRILATRGTCDFLNEHGIKAERVLRVNEGRPNLVDLILNHEVDLVANTPSPSAESATDGSLIRRTAIKAHVPYMTTMAAALATAKGIQVAQSSDPQVHSLQEIHANISYE